MKLRYRCAITTLLLLVSATLPAESSKLFNTDGYRIDRYRAALPDTSPAGARIGTEALAALIATADPGLVDVQAVTVRPETEEFGISWLPSRERRNIPGSIWLPNVGYGELDARMLRYFSTHLESLTRGDKAYPLVFYCVVDCWMSWNAVRRAAAMGYTKLYWYPEGSDGWEEAGRPLVRAQPIELDSPDHEICSLDQASFFLECAEINLERLLSNVRNDPQLQGIVLFFETEDCPFCKRMRAGVLRNASVIDAYHRRYIPVSLDLNRDARLVTETGRVTTEQDYGRDVHRVVRTPTMVFLDSNGEAVHRQTGIVVDPRVLIALVDYIASAKYEEMGFREYHSRQGR